MLKLALSLKRGLILYHLHQLWCEKNMLTSFGSREHTLISPGISISHVATSRAATLPNHVFHSLHIGTAAHFILALFFFLHNCALILHYFLFCAIFCNDHKV
jgi:hypothetical protein